MAPADDRKPVLNKLLDKLKIEGPDPSITDLLDFYLNNTNMHGMRRIAVSKGPIKKVIWIVLSLIAVSMIFWQGILLILSFYSISVSVAISYTKIPFPAITICSLTPYKYNESKTLLEKLDANAAMALHNIGIAVNNVSASQDLPDRLPMPLVWLDTTATNQTVITEVISGEFRVVPGMVNMTSSLAPNDRSFGRLIAIELVFNVEDTQAVEWKTLNRLRTRTGRSKDALVRWGYKTGPTTCECGEADHTMEHCLVCALLPNLCSSKDLAEFNENARGCCGNKTECIYNGFTSAVDAVIEWYHLHFINIMAELPDEAKDKLGYSADEFIIDCVFSGTLCNPKTDFLKFQHPSLGNCFTFNDGRDGEQKHSEIASAGIDHGLYMVLNTRQGNSVPYLAMGAGAKIAIHLQNTTSFIEAVGINIPPASESSLGIRMNVVQKLSEPYSNCTMDGSDVAIESLYNSPYSVETCQNSCFQREMVKNCGCANYEQPLPDGSSYCNYNNSGWEYCYYKLYDMYIQEQLNCIQICRQICSETEHVITLSLADWPSEASKGWMLQVLSHERGLLNNETLEPTDIAMVNIYFNDLTLKTVSESPANSVVTLLSNLGGLLGLWLSCSILCFLELLEIFCVDLPWILLKKLWAKCRRLFSALIREARPPAPRPSGPPVQMPTGELPGEDPPTFHTAMQCSRDPIPMPNTPPPQYNTLRLRQVAGYVAGEDSDGED